jgi:hypothetical protein
MHNACYSSVLDQPADKVWSLVRDFNNYPRYIEGVSESIIEDGKPGDEVGAVRRFCYAGTWLRQRLTAHSDRDRAFAYAGLDPFHFPTDLGADPPGPIDYEGSLRLTPIVDGDRTFIEWSVTFRSPPNEATRWTEFLLVAIPQWIDSLRRTLARQD